MRITGRGAAVAVLAGTLVAGGLWARYPGVVGLGAALAVLLVASVVGVLLPAPILVRRRLTTTRVTRLQDCHGVLSVSNRSTYLPVRLDGADLVGGEPVPVDVPVLAPKQETEVELSVPTRRRGVVELGPLTLQRQGLARLLLARTTFPERSSIVVVPRLLPIAGLPSGLQRSHLGTDERVEHGGMDIVGLHEYVPGDDLRRLHWASSAKTGTLMIRDDADPSRPHVTVVLDDRAHSYVDDGFEEAVDLVASVLARAAEDSHAARVLTVSGSLDIDLAAGPPAGVGASATAAIMDPLLDQLAMLVPAGDQADAALETGLHGSDIVAVVSGSAGPTAELLLQAGRSSSGVLAVVDPQATRLTEVVGGVVVLRGPRAEDLVAGWDLAVAR